MKLYDLSGSGAVIWDSGVPLGMEYGRSCAILDRFNTHINHDCQDGIHQGNFLMVDFIHVMINGDDYECYH